MANFDLNLFCTVPGTERAVRTAAGHRALVALIQEYRVEGIHIFDRDAAELIQLTAFAVDLGATKNQIDNTLTVHPNTAEKLATISAHSC